MMHLQVIRPNRYEEQMSAAEPASGAGGTGRRKLEVSISVQTILLVQPAQPPPSSTDRTREWQPPRIIAFA